MQYSRAFLIRSEVRCPEQVRRRPIEAAEESRGKGAAEGRPLRRPVSYDGQPTVYARASSTT